MSFPKILSRVFVAAIVVFAGSAHAQRLFGVNPFQNDASGPPASNGLFYLDNNTGAIIDGRVVTVPARTITGLLALTVDPTTGTVYAVAKANAVAGRLLITLDITTGAGVEIGNLGDQFSTLAFRSDGQLFGVTGDGAAVPETLYLINKANATKVIATALGNGADGEVIAYNPNDNSFYHWSGNGTIVFERVLATGPYTVTNIPITGSGSGEIFGAVWDPARGQFLVHNISSSMDFWTTAGVRSNAQAATLADVRGLVLFADTGQADIPTLGEWAIALLALLMGIAGFAAMRRRSGSAG
jgi:hypothetical protein